ncbi:MULTISPECIES: SPOR domain-containing protein [unclassified Carboxylicivirga]|uniref:SPOR domain-containing protein n=1 Tax=Carboxylicivirga TaxID=1628153 RepID=UPI003D357E06
MKKAIVFLLLLCPLLVIAQEDRSLSGSLQQSVEGQGAITIYDMNGVEELLTIQKEVNQRMDGVDGFRIQLFSGLGPTGKRNALRVKSKFLSRFPDYDVDVSFTSPNWRVRVGNYRHRHEALPLLNDLRELFPNCYIVKDGSVDMNKL